jgi:hydroxymethylbilane synthase
LITIKTQGDRILDSPLGKIGGKGLFVKEIEDALLRNEVDLAVHSMKDLPADLPEGLEIPVFPPREDARDAFISTQCGSIADLPLGASVGTGSLRRSAQLLHIRPDLRIVPMRGNVDTRLKKMESGNLHGIVLASAGLRRLGLAHRISQIISPDTLLPAIGQGALGLEMRKGDRAVEDLLGFFNHVETELAVKAERALLKGLEGGCQVPIGGYARLEGDRLILQGMVAELDGRSLIRVEAVGPRECPEKLGAELARKILASGADKILAKIYGR